MDNIDQRCVTVFLFKAFYIYQHRIACVPPFTGLRRFPQGQGFKQWTGDDSQALMKVIIPMFC